MAVNQWVLCTFSKIFSLPFFSKNIVRYYKSASQSWSAKEMRSIVTNVLWSVCVHVSVSLLVTTMIRAKTSEAVEMLFALWTWVDPRNHVLRRGLISLMGIGNFGSSPCPLWNIGNMRCEPKLFGMWQQRCICLLSVLQQLVVSYSCVYCKTDSLHCRLQKRHTTFVWKSGSLILRRKRREWKRNYQQMKK